MVACQVSIRVITEQFSTLQQDHFQWAMGQRRWQHFGSCSEMASAFHDRASPCIFGWHRKLCSDSDIWNYSWAHTVMSIAESCLFLMQCRLRAWRSHTSIIAFQPCPLHGEILRTPICSWLSVETAAATAQIVGCWFWKGVRLLMYPHTWIANG